jgi:hypothetical protein
MRYLRQNTATIVTIGPFVDKTDGVTLEDAIAEGDDEKITFVVDANDGGAPTVVLDMVATNASPTNDVTDLGTSGYYGLELTAGNTNYVGRAVLSITNAAVHAPVFHEFTILPANAFDTLLGTDLLNVNAAEISGDSTAADAVEAAYDATDGPVALHGIIDQGTAQSATGTTVVLRAASAFANDTLIGATIAVYGSDQAYWQQRVITDNTLSDDTVTVDTWTVTPSGTITYKIFATPPASGSLLPDVNVEKINNVQVVGAGTSGDKWRA